MEREELTLSVKWSDIVNNFREKIQSLTSDQHTRVLLDSTNTIVDGMKLKWINILILDILLTIHGRDDFDLRVFEMHRRRKFDQYAMFRMSIVECCCINYLEMYKNQVNVDDSFSDSINVVDFQDEWTNINMFVDLIQQDHLHRSWRRRMDVTIAMKRILKDMGMTLQALIKAVICRVYQMDFLHQARQSSINTESGNNANASKFDFRPMISATNIRRFFELINGHSNYNRQLALRSSESN